MKYGYVLLLILAYSAIVPNMARANDWQKVSPKPWPKITISQINLPVNEKAGSDVGSVVNVIERNKAKPAEYQCNKRTEYGYWVPVHCGKS